MAEDAPKKQHQYVSIKSFRDFEFLEGLEPETYTTVAGKERERFCKARCKRCVGEKLVRIVAPNGQLHLNSWYHGRSASTIRGGASVIASMYYWEPLQAQSWVNFIIFSMVLV